jgi:hypothetical protein
MRLSNIRPISPPLQFGCGRYKSSFANARVLAQIEFDHLKHMAELLHNVSV